MFASAAPVGLFLYSRRLSRLTQGFLHISLTLNHLWASGSPGAVDWPLSRSLETSSRNLSTFVQSVHFVVLCVLPEKEKQDECGAICLGYGGSACSRGMDWTLLSHRLYLCLSC